MILRATICFSFILSVLQIANAAEHTTILSGIGAALELKEGNKITVVELIGKAPADRSGQLHLGDEILSVQTIPHSDVADLKEMPLNLAVDLIRGEEGIPVTLEIQRKAEKKTITLVREKFEVQVND